MRIGILGPTKIDNFCRLKGIQKEYFLKSIEFLASHLAKSTNSVYVVPDGGSTAYLFSEFYQMNQDFEY